MSMIVLNNTICAILYVFLFHIYAGVYMYVCVCICMYIYMCVCVCICMCGCVCTDTYIDWRKLHKKQHVSAFFGKSVLKCHLT